MNNNKIEKILFITLGILFLLFIIGSIQKKLENYEKTEKFALLSKEKLEKIAHFSLKEEEKTLNFINYNGEWKGLDENENIFPIEKDRLEHFFTELAKIINISTNLYTIDKNITQPNKNYNLISLNFYFEDENRKDFETIYFSSFDFSHTKRFVFSEKSKKARLIPISQLESFLTSSKSFWAESYLVPRFLNFNTTQDLKSAVQKISITQNGKTITFLSKYIKEEKISKFLEFRHGSIKSISKEKADFLENSQSVQKEIITIELDSYKIFLTFFTTKDEEIILHTKITELFPPAQTTLEKEEYSFFTEVSLWTKNEIFKTLQ